MEAKWSVTPFSFNTRRVLILSFSSRPSTLLNKSLSLHGWLLRTRRVRNILIVKLNSTRPSSLSRNWIHPKKAIGYICVWNCVSLSRGEIVRGTRERDMFSRHSLRLESKSWRPPRIAGWTCCFSSARFWKFSNQCWQLAQDKSSTKKNKIKIRLNIALNNLLLVKQTKKTFLFSENFFFLRLHCPWGNWPKRKKSQKEYNGF